MIQRRVRMLAFASLLGLAPLAGCATQDGRTAGAREVEFQQRYHIDIVRARAVDLRPGMSKAEVYVLLGAPAEYRGDTWVYRSAPGSEGKDETFQVRFNKDGYIGHSG